MTKTEQKKINWQVFFNDFILTYGIIILALLFWKINPLLNKTLLVFLLIWTPICLVKSYLIATYRLTKKTT